MTPFAIADEYMTLATSRRGWVIYALALTLGVIIGEVLNLRRGPPTLLTLGNWLLTIALLTSLWAYALRRPLGTATYWRAVFWIVLFANLVMLVPILLVGGAIAWFTGGLTLLIVPAYYAAYRYAYRTPELWSKVT